MKHFVGLEDKIMSYLRPPASQKVEGGDRSGWKDGVTVCHKSRELAHCW